MAGRRWAWWAVIALAPMPKAPPKPTKPKRVRRSPEESRARILEAAIRVISERGPEAAGLKQVAEEAGVSHGLVAHYFGTFEALVDAAVLECAARLRDRMLTRFRENPELRAEDFMHIYLDAVLEPWYGRLVSWALMSDREGERSRAAQLAPDLKLIADATHHMMQRRVPGQTRAQSEAFMVGLWSMAIGYVACNGFFWRALGRTPGPKRDRELRETASAMAKAMFG